MISYSLYVSLPYCTPDCRLCRTTQVVPPDLEKEYPAAVIKEIREWRQAAGKIVPVQSIFIGGPCPTRLSPPVFKTLLQSIAENYDLEPGAEVTLEAVPGTVPQGGFQRFNDLGINRISLEWYGIYGEELGFLGRPYRYQDVSRAVTSIRKAGIDNLNVDLMFGIPGQELSQWRKMVDAALSFEPKHISAYSFHPEEGSVMKSWVEKGLVAFPEPEERSAMYAHLDDRLGRAGYTHYELSSWAKPGYACQHNLRYWRLDPYLGFGADAHGYVGDRRIRTISSPSRYVEALKDEERSVMFPATSASLPGEELSKEAYMLDFVFMGLHLIQEGVSRRRFYKRFQLNLEEIMADVIHPSLEEGLLEWTEDSLRFTERGLAYAPHVLRRLVREDVRG